MNNNLKPFTGADDPRRQNGRKKGSKNFSTIVGELLANPINPDIINSDHMRGYPENSPATYATALAYSMIIKAINGDVRAATGVSSYVNEQSGEEEGFFQRANFVFNVVPNRPRPDEES